MSQRNPSDLEATKYAQAFLTNGGDQTKAFKKAFPKSKAKPETLNNCASKFHKLPKIRTRIEELRVELNKAADEEALYTVNDKKRWLMEIVGYGVAEEVIPMPQWKQDAGYKDEYRQRNPSAAVSAIKELNLMDGDHAPIKSQSEHNFPTGDVTINVVGK